MQPDLAAVGALLLTYGIVMPVAREASPGTAATIADGIGYPVAVKAVHRRAGRSARAGVALDLASGDDVVDAVATMTDALGDDAAELIVQRMVSPGVDLRIRCERDGQLGCIVTVGLGGAQADLIDDRTSRLAPVSPATARSMLRVTRAGAALTESGFDETDVVDVIVELAQLVSDQPDVADIDLNPVIVSADGAFVTDAVVRLVPATAWDRSLRTLE
jgi:acyl-CoA synthetase (NDP forming)